MKTPDILSTIKNCDKFLPADTCHLYLWVTNNFLKDGLWIVEQLGFRYITLLTWAKSRFGLGYYFRGQTEHVIFSIKGKLAPLAKTESTLIGGERTQHSLKPSHIYKKIENVSPTPRLEMFARTHRIGWDIWDMNLDVPEYKSKSTPGLFKLK